jgi:hypothetical protein
VPESDLGSHLHVRECICAAIRKFVSCISAAVDSSTQRASLSAVYTPRGSVFGSSYRPAIDDSADKEMRTKSRLFNRYRLPDGSFAIAPVSQLICFAVQSL